MGLFSIEQWREITSKYSGRDNACENSEIESELNFF